ncbi:MAG: ABC transporter permease [Chloroflexi bacterium]|nr:MAG: ABC transporter permease [Chloroflexota bacterium]
MSITFVIRRLIFLVFVIWAAATITFFIPRLSTRNPVRQRLAELATKGGFSSTDLEAMVKSYNTKFGLDKPLVEQYFDYVGSLARGDLGVSLYKYPRTVLELIGDAVPWTLALLLVTTILSFIIGNLLGAVAAWPRSPGWLRTFATPFVLLQGMPPVLMGFLLLFFVAFRLRLAPLGNAYSSGIIPDWSSPEFLFDVFSHMVLPALSLILGTVGGWVLSMRGMGVTIQGEDYVTYAEHKGLGGTTIFRDYYLRNAMLPQVTGLALALTAVVTSGVVVEQIFGLPGIGQTLSLAIANNDFLVIYGIVLFITIAVATLMVGVELMYPLLDPRVRHA